MDGLTLLIHGLTAATAALLFLRVVCATLQTQIAYLDQKERRLQQQANLLNFKSNGIPSVKMN